MDFRNWNEVVKEGALVVMCEVLDNLPHDKVRISRNSSGSALAAHVSLPSTVACLSSDPLLQWASNPDGPFIESCTMVLAIALENLMENFIIVIDRVTACARVDIFNTP
jgi:hypothetical protein